MIRGRRISPRLNDGAVFRKDNDAILIKDSDAALLKDNDGAVPEENDADPTQENDAVLLKRNSAKGQFNVIDHLYSASLRYLLIGLFCADLYNNHNNVSLYYVTCHKERMCSID